MVENFPLILLSQQNLLHLEALFFELIDRSDEVFLAHQHSRHRVELNFSSVRFICEMFEPESAYSEFKQIMLNSNLSDARSGIAITFAEFVNSPTPIMPLVKLLLELTSQFVKSLPVFSALWEPAKLASGPEFFRSSVQDFVTGGAFPSLSLIRFESAKRGILRTRGLAWFAGQEIELLAGHLPEYEAVRRLVRIIHDIVENGAIVDDVETAGLVEGERILLTLQNDDKLVCAKSISEMEE